jgi:hypothetical protein
MWISKKKLASKEREIKHEAFLKQLEDESRDKQWEDIQKLKKDVKKLKKAIKAGW